jgi:hypothetical protein
MTRQAVHWANLTVAFLLELCALAALGSWGVHVGGGPAAKAALGIGAPLLAALLWGRFAAPRAPVSRPAVKVGVQLLVFGSAALPCSPPATVRLLPPSPSWWSPTPSWCAFDT